MPCLSWVSKYNHFNPLNTNNLSLNEFVIENKNCFEYARHFVTGSNRNFEQSSLWNYCIIKNFHSHILYMDIKLLISYILFSFQSWIENDIVTDNSFCNSTNHKNSYNFQSTSYFKYWMKNIKTFNIYFPIAVLIHVSCQWSTSTFQMQHGALLELSTHF